MNKRTERLMAAQKRGAELLDQFAAENPTHETVQMWERCGGWRNYLRRRMQVKKLDTRSTDNCVLAILFERYSTGVKALFQDVPYPSIAEFETAADHGFAGDVSDYPILDVIWPFAIQMDADQVRQVLDIAFPADEFEGIDA